MLDRYKAIIFDWDGTLVDSHEWVLNAHNHVRKVMGRPLWTKDDIFGNASFSARETYPMEYGDEAQKASEILHQYVKEHNHQSSKPYPASEEVLKKLNATALPMGVVSNKRHEPLNEIIEHLNWSAYFKVAIGAGYAEKDKPDPSPLLMAINHIDAALEPSDTLYIGDTETDMLTAKNAGCDAILVQTDRPRPDLIEKYSPLHAWDDLRPLLDCIQQAA